MRIFLPATVPMLRTLVERGELAPVRGLGFALTPALREAYATGDAEELEYAAMLDAARAALRLLAADPGAPARRVVVTVDADATPRPDLDDAAVALPGPVPMRAVAAVHIDTAEAEDAVRAAVAVVDAADLGDPDAEFTLGDAEDQEMAWYDPQELPFLLELM